AKAVLGELNLLLRRRTRWTALFLGPVRIGVMDKLLPLVVRASFVEPELLKPQNGGLLADLEAASGPPNVVEAGVPDGVGRKECSDERRGCEEAAGEAIAETLGVIEPHERIGDPALVHENVAKFVDHRKVATRACLLLGVDYDDGMLGMGKAKAAAVLVGEAVLEDDDPLVLDALAADVVESTGVLGFGLVL